MNIVLRLEPNSFDCARQALSEVLDAIDDEEGELPAGQSLTITTTGGVCEISLKETP